MSDTQSPSVSTTTRNGSEVKYRNGNGNESPASTAENDAKADEPNEILPVKDELDGAQEISIDELMAFRRDEDPDCLLGLRWICKGGTAVWQGPTGVGKSSLMMQGVITWSLGRPFFGIKPVRALKFLVIQAENDMAI
jgi:RecA-family ATPase